MIQGLLGRSTPVAMLKDGLDASVARTYGIAHRVSNASTPGGAGFAGALEEQVSAAGGAVNLEAEMVALADEQLRFDATARLLRKVYDQVRSSVRSR